MLSYLSIKGGFSGAPDRVDMIWKNYSKIRDLLTKRIESYELEENRT